MNLNYRPLYMYTDSLYKDKDYTTCSHHCKNDVLLMKQHLNQIYGTQIEGDKRMNFDLQTFYEQILSICEVVSTTTLQCGMVRQELKSHNGTRFFVYINVIKYRINNIEIFRA